MANLLLPLEDCSAVAAEHIGGKALNLGLLLKAGIPVPPGFVITSEAWRTAIEYNGLEPTLRRAGRDLRTEDTVAAWRELGTALAEAALPPELRDEILAAARRFEGKALVVRSSAIGEDSEGQSFAGQYETYLNVRSPEQLLAAVRDCWASAWTDRVLAYLRAAGAPVADVGRIAVIVQEMVDAAVAGVAFTQNPLLPDREEMLVESAFGLGAAIVEGKVAADSFRVERATGRLVDKTIRYKLLRCVPGEAGGVVYRKSEEDRRALESLAEDQLQALWRLASAIREVYGTEQDIEWAGDGRTLYILQSRPITTIDRERDFPEARNDKTRRDPNALLTMVDIGESWTGVLTPLGASFIRQYQYHTHPALLAELGLRYTGEPERYCRFILGRCYADASYLAWLLAQCVLFSDQAGFMRRYATEDVDLGNYANPYGGGPGGLRGLLSNLAYLKTQLRHWRNYEKRVEKLAGERLALFDAARSKNLSTLSTAELREELEQAYRYFHDSSVVMAPAYIGSFIYYDVLKALCETWLKDDGSLLHSLKSGTSDLRTLDVNTRLEALLAEARAHPGLRDHILATPVEALDAGLRRHPEAGRFLELYDDFLRVHGVRGRLEMDLSLPRWVDDPGYVFTVLKAGLGRAGTSGEAAKPDRQDGVAGRLAELGFWKRGIFNWAMRRYFDNSRVREETRMSYLQGIWLVRRVVQETARRLIGQGVLRNPEEAAFITYEQVNAYLAGEGDVWQIFKRSGIERNRRAHYRNLRIHNPPLTVIGDWSPAAEVPPAPADGTLRGVGGSAGQAMGRARVIFDLQRQMDEFEPGEILVTQFTDTTWTPLFSIAAAVVTDIGSVLSHSAIVARELGIPAVVNTKTATEAIRTGDLVVVDGSAGKVFRPAEAETAALPH